MISRITFALTNFHTSLMPLRATDGDFYKATLGKYFTQGEDKLNARAASQARYRRRRAIRLRTERVTQDRAVGRPYNRIQRDLFSPSSAGQRRNEESQSIQYPSPQY